jgi:hypothetical protein
VDLSWLPRLNLVQLLSLSNNRISGGLSALLLQGLHLLRELNLSGNCIDDFNELRSLSPLRNLRALDLRWNEVCHTPDYAKLARALIPSLESLDTDSDSKLPRHTRILSDQPWSLLVRAYAIGDEDEDDNDEDEEEDDGEQDGPNDVVMRLRQGDVEAPFKRARLANEDNLYGSDSDADFETEASDDEEEDEEDEDDDVDDDDVDVKDCEDEQVGKGEGENLYGDVYARPRLSERVSGPRNGGVATVLNNGKRGNDAQNMVIVTSLGQRLYLKKKKCRHVKSLKVRKCCHVPGNDCTQTIRDHQIKNCLFWMCFP